VGIFQTVKQKIVLKSVLGKARQGDFENQYYLGMAYLFGTYVLQNYEEAYFWLTLAQKNIPIIRDAVEAGNVRKNTEDARNKAAEKLSPDQIAIVDGRVFEWNPLRKR
jgi:hypothetical protein